MKLMFHDDNCSELLDADGLCPRCGFHPDNSVGIREVAWIYQDRTYLAPGHKPYYPKPTTIDNRPIAYVGDMQ